MEALASSRHGRGRAFDRPRSCSASLLPSATNNSSPWSIGRTRIGGLPSGSSRSRATWRWPESCQHRPERVGAAVDRRPDLGPRAGEAARFERSLEHVHQPGIAADGGALRPQHRQRQEIAVVALEPRQQAGAHERGLARSRGAEDHQQAGRGSVAQPAQAVERLDDRCITPEKDAGVLGFERLEATVGRPLWIGRRRPGEEPGIEAGALQPGLEPRETLPPRR